MAGVLKGGTAISCNWYPSNATKNNATALFSKQSFETGCGTVVPVGEEWFASAPPAPVPGVSPLSQNCYHTSYTTSRVTTG